MCGSIYHKIIWQGEFSPVKITHIYTFTCNICNSKHQPCWNLLLYITMVSPKAMAGLIATGKLSVKLPKDPSKTTDCKDTIQPGAFVIYQFSVYFFFTM